MTTTSDSGPLRRVIEASGVTMGEGTVLAPQNDPYRQDTPAGHRDGQWFAEQVAGKAAIHLRGLHYAIVVRGTVLKPNGVPYTNNDDDWAWLQEHASKAARWLGYVPFEAIIDRRSSDPIYVPAVDHSEPAGWVEPGIVSVPTSAAIDPSVYVTGFTRQQPYQLVIFAEKASLGDVVLPLAHRVGADAYLETGEISDTHLYAMARRNQLDGRPLRVFTVADFDPAGWQMPISIGRKLQALRDLYFPAMDFEVHPVALLPDQVRTLRLPSTPLKAEEKRAAAWRQRWGHEQTEVDALLELQPAALNRFLRAALKPFLDGTLEARVRDAHREWMTDAEQAVSDQIDHAQLQRLRAKAENAVQRFRKDITAVNDGLEALTTDIELPEVIVPEIELDPTHQGTPLVSSAWSWLEQTRALKARKSYD